MCWKNVGIYICFFFFTSPRVCVRYVCISLQIWSRGCMVLSSGVILRIWEHVCGYGSIRVDSMMGMHKNRKMVFLLQIPWYGLLEWIDIALDPITWMHMMNVCSFCFTLRNVGCGWDVIPDMIMWIYGFWLQISWYGCIAVYGWNSTRMFGVFTPHYMMRMCYDEWLMAGRNVWVFAGFWLQIPWHGCIAMYEWNSIRMCGISCTTSQDADVLRWMANAPQGTYRVFAPHHMMRMYQDVCMDIAP
jgi:hypothetical protein